MPKSSAQDKVGGITTEAVKRATGKEWSQWLSILDKAGARKMNHTQIAAYLSEKQKVPGWWCQMVAVGYEQARGIRETHQRPDGYEISVSRVVNVPLANLFKSWEEAKQRDKWLGAKESKGLEVRKATSNKSMRITWGDKKTSLEVNFYDKGKGKTQVVVQHSKLKDSKQAEKMKGYWGKKLDGLKVHLEK